MKLSDIFLTLFYGAASVLIIFLLVRLITRSNKPDTVVVYRDETPVYYEANWWPWAGAYNYYPYWFPWSGWYGGDGGYGGRWHHGHRWGGNRPYGGAGRGAYGGAGRSGAGRGGGRGGGHR